jgi:hypothetical protein
LSQLIAPESSIMVVAAKWMGTRADTHDMEKLQLEQVLRVGEVANGKGTLKLLCRGILAK